MNTQIKLLLILACALIPFSGCTERREALGGGAESETHVTVLRVGDGNVTVADNNQDVAEKITTFGTFKGRVVVKGTVAQLGLIFAKGAAPGEDFCRNVDIPNESIIVSADGGLANVFVYLRRAPKNVDIPAPPTDAVVLDQVGCKFIPHASVVQVDQPLVLKNSDPKTTHNVRGQGLGFRIDETLSGDSTKEIRATRGETKPAQIVCNFHSWMSGWVLPLDHPWGTVTGSDGSFEIQGVPSGEMEFAFYHEGEQIAANMKVEIPADGTAPEAIIEIDASQLVN